MKTLNVLLALVLFTFFAACENSNEPEPVNRSQVYSNGELGFKITVPEGWNVERDAEINGYKTLLYAVKERTETEETSFNIISQNIPVGVSLEIIANASEATLSGMFENVVLDGRYGYVKNGLECSVIEYHFTLNGKVVKQKQVFFISNEENLVVITFNSSENGFKKYSDEIEEVINSLKSI